MAKGSCSVAGVGGRSGGCEWAPGMTDRVQLTAVSCSALTWRGRPAAASRSRICPILAADEFRLDEVQQGMDAYHIDHVSNLPGSAGPRRPAAPAAPARVADGSRLVTTLIDPYAVDSQELTRALLRAGASSIVVSEVHHYSREEEQVVRAERKTVD